MKRPTMALVFALASACLASGGRARGDVELREESRNGKVVYVVGNGLLSATVDPADGGAISLVAAGGGAGLALTARPEGQPGAVLCRDAVGGKVCAYRVAYRAASSSVGVLELVWSNEVGLSITKTVALLSRQLVVRVAYRIDNGLPRNEDVRMGFRLGPDERKAWAVRVSQESGFSQYLGPSLGQGAGEALEDVRWFGATQPPGGGVAVVAGVGTLSRLLLSAPRDGTTIEMEGATILVPAGRTLKARLALACWQNLAAPAAATEQLVCSVSMDRAGQTARANLTVLPLADLGSGEVALRLTSRPAGAVETIPSAPRQMLCGKAEALSFYWKPREATSYRVELIVPGVKDPVVLGACVLGNDDVSFTPHVRRPTERVDLEEFAPKLPEAADRDSRRPAPFFGAEGTALSGLQVAVGIGERETVVFGVHGTGGLPADLRLSGLVTERGARALPSSSLSLVRVIVAQDRGATDVPGAIVPPQASPAETTELAALRLSTPHVEADTYRGHIELAAGFRTASLPVAVRVWPVRRPRPGLVRLYVNEPASNPLADDIPVAACESLRDREVVNAAFRARDLLEADGVAVRPDRGAKVPLKEWLAMQRRSEDGAPPASKALPPLDFSAANERLQRLLLEGLGDVTVSGSVSAAGLSPAGVSDADRPAMAAWFWAGLADHLRSMGFGRLYFMEEAPVQESALAGEWFAAASVLHKAGWSVCGPYGSSVLGVPRAERAAVLARAAAVSRLILVDAPLAEAVREMRASVPGGTEVGVWAVGLAVELSAEQARQYVRQVSRGGADVVVLGSAAVAVSGGSVKYAQEGRAAGSWSDLDSAAWDGFRDGLDEMNYARMLSRYERTAGAAAPGPDDAGVPKAQALERLSLRGKAGRAGPGDTWWNELVLAEDGRPSAVIGVEPGSPEQRAQAGALNQLLEVKGGVSLPVVDLSELPGAPQPKVVLLLGSPDTNRLVRRLSAGRPDLSWRLAANGYMFVRFAEERTTYLALLTAREADWGRPLVLFNVMLRQEGGWVQQ